MSTLNEDIERLSATAFRIKEQRDVCIDALRQVLVLLENLEARVLIGDEGCIWTAEIVRDALKRAEMTP